MQIYVQIFYSVTTHQNKVLMLTKITRLKRIYFFEPTTFGYYYKSKH